MGVTVVWTTFLAAVALAGLHLIGGRLKFLDVVPRSRWLSIAGGVAVAYALLHLLPELHEHTQVFAGVEGRKRPLAEQLVYVLTLVGLVTFYGLERVARHARGHPDPESVAPTVFWLHVASYAVYNALIGYLLVREQRSGQSMLLFTIGIGLHFVVNDYGLQHHHRQRYRLVGRWILGAAILLGWLIGQLTEIHEAVTASIVAFLAGGILLNTFKEELPEERESRYWAFAAGAFGYAALLLAA